MEEEEEEEEEEWKEQKRRNKRQRKYKKQNQEKEEEEEKIEHKQGVGRRVGREKSKENKMKTQTLQVITENLVVHSEVICLNKSLYSISLDKWWENRIKIKAK